MTRTKTKTKTDLTIHDAPKAGLDPAHYIAIDIETTGLDPRKDRILEIAVVVLTEDLKEIYAYHHQVYASPLQLERCDEYVRKMHLGSGLLEPWNGGLRLSTPHLYGARFLLDETEGELCLVIGRNFGEVKPTLLGQSVHFDRGFLEHWMPLAAERLSHRNFDARTAIELFPGAGWPVHKGSPHRAMPDIQRSIAILRRARSFGPRRNVTPAPNYGTVFPESDANGEAG